MSIVLLLIGVLLVLYRQGRVFKKLAAKMQAYREETNVYGVNLRGEVNGVLKQMKNLQKYGMITDEEYTLAEQDLTARITKKPVIDNDTK